MLVRDVLARIEAMPFVSLDSIVGDAPFAVLAPHPDDETLGCGGLIAAARARAQPVQVVVVTDGAGSHVHSKVYPPARLAAARRDEVARAVDTLGLPAENLTCLDLPDTAAPVSGPAFHRALEEIGAILDRSGARTLFVTWKYDPHCDHEAVALMAEALAAQRPGLRLWSYPIWGLHRAPDETISEPPPEGVRLDIEPWLDAKRAAIRCHATQMTRLIDDDPEGFCFTDETLRPFLAPYERFLAVVP